MGVTWGSLQRHGFSVPWHSAYPMGVARGSQQRRGFQSFSFLSTNEASSLLICVAQLDAQGLSRSGVKVAVVNVSRATVLNLVELCCVVVALINVLRLSVSPTVMIELRLLFGVPWGVLGPAPH